MPVVAPDSTQAGYLRPDPAGLGAREYDVALEDIFQDLAVGLTGLGGAFVRPKYPEHPAAVPGQQVDWCAFGVTVNGADWNPVVVSDPNANGGQGEHRVARSEDVSATFSFYGPHNFGNAAQMRDGLFVGQNRDAIEAKGLKLVGCADIVFAPLKVKEVWVRKADLRVSFRRWVTRTYGIRNLASADGTIDNERYVTTFSAHP